MFGVGLHFSLKDLLSVRALAMPGAIVQIAGAAPMGLGLALLLGWGIGAGLIFGLALSVASTVVLLKALRGSPPGRERQGPHRGWLADRRRPRHGAWRWCSSPRLPASWAYQGAELHDPFIDLVERMLNTELGIFGVLAITLVKLAAFVGFMLVVGRRLIPMVLHYTAHTGSRELFRLAVLAIALGVAAGVGLPLRRRRWRSAPSLPA